MDAHLDLAQQPGASPLSREQYAGSARQLVGGNFGWVDEGGQLWLEAGAHHDVAYYFAEPSVGGVSGGRLTGTINRNALNTAMPGNVRPSSRKGEGVGGGCGNPSLGVC